MLNLLPSPGIPYHSPLPNTVKPIIHVNIQTLISWCGLRVDLSMFLDMGLPVWSNLTNDWAGYWPRLLKLMPSCHFRFDRLSPVWESLYLSTKLKIDKAPFFQGVHVFFFYRLTWRCTTVISLKWLDKASIYSSRLLQSIPSSFFCFNQLTHPRFIACLAWEYYRPSFT